MKKEYAAPDISLLSMRIVLLGASGGNKVDAGGSTILPEGGGESPGGGRAKESVPDTWTEWE